MAKAKKSPFPDTVIATRVLRYMQSRYDIFDPENPVLLKINIHYDILKECGRDVSGADMSVFLDWWVHRDGYLAIQTPDAPRFDLYGNRAPSYNEHAEMKSKAA